MIEGVGPSRAPDLPRAARAFESLFFHLVVKSMRASVPQGGPFGGGRGGALFTDLLDLRFADAAARRGPGLGIAGALLRRFAR